MPAIMRPRCRRLALLVVAAVAAVVALQTATPERALAIDGIERVPQTWERDDAAVKSLPIVCPPGKLALGGGVEIDDGFRDRVRLTQFEVLQGFDYAFFVRAESEFGTRAFQWSLTGFALCADRETLRDADYTIVNRTVENPTSKRFMSSTSPTCPSGTVAYSAGARIENPGNSSVFGLIGLQLVRTDAPMSIGRGTARETDAGGGFPYDWTLDVSAVCAKRLGSPHVAAAGADPTDPHYATAKCGPEFVHGAGGGASAPGFSDPGPTWLKAIFPLSGPKSLLVRTTGTQYGPVAWATCAT